MMPAAFGCRRGLASKPAKMLDAIRKRAKGFLAVFLFAILIVSFGIWGIGDIFRGGGREPAAAEVGDLSITLQDVGNELQREIRRMEARLGAKIDTEQAQRLGLLATVVDRLVAQALFDLEARATGVTVSEDLIRTRVQSDAAFRNEQGEFDPARFERMLFNNGWSEGYYVSRERAAPAPVFPPPARRAGRDPGKWRRRHRGRRLKCQGCAA